MSVKFYDHVYIGETFYLVEYLGLKSRSRKKLLFMLTLTVFWRNHGAQGAQARGRDQGTHLLCNFASVIGEGLAFDCPVS